jgi:hypothetical protein
MTETDPASETLFRETQDEWLGKKKGKAIRVLN